MKVIFKFSHSHSNHDLDSFLKLPGIAEHSNCIIYSDIDPGLGVAWVGFSSVRAAEDAMRRYKGKAERAPSQLVPKACIEGRCRSRDVLVDDPLVDSITQSELYDSFLLLEQNPVPLEEELPLSRRSVMLESHAFLAGTNAAAGKMKQRRNEKIKKK